MAKASSKEKFIFDFEKLLLTFGEICPDFATEPNYMNATISRRFAEQVIFEFSKDAKKAKKEKRDQTWILKFENIKYPVRIKVTTFNTKTPPQIQPSLVNNCLQLNFKQASLLAVHKYCQLVPHQVKRNQIVLTPLAGAVFNKNDLPKLAEALNEPLDKLIMSIISSSQTDGYYLAHSRCHIALVVLMNTISDLQMRCSLLKKTIKMYKLHGKDFDIQKFKIFSEFLANLGTKAKPSIDDEVEQLLSQILAMQLPKLNKRDQTKDENEVQEINIEN
ncbi:uncharacterized protein LOC111518967 [Drosophila willistoni]|uniref:uncharacterized protein LOC111518967 n=1 Tax=Drosophila willistoni TaxID=7260 RepID=UPI00017D7FAC|nr:uncharacterized protein LOC111518967 [Drosophila willistoni]